MRQFSRACKCLLYISIKSKRLYHHPENEKKTFQLAAPQIAPIGIYQNQNEKPDTACTHFEHTHARTHTTKLKQVYNRNIIRSFTFCLYFHLLSSHIFFCMSVVAHAAAIYSGYCCCILNVLLSSLFSVCACTACVCLVCVYNPHYV